MLSKVYGKNSYCGPGAIATVTGLTSDEAARALREVTGKRSIHGVTSCELEETLEYLGIDYQYYAFTEYYDKKLKQVIHRNPTLTQFIKWRDSVGLKNKTFIVDLTSHFIAVEGDYANDNCTKSKVLIKDFGMTRTRVKRARLIKGF